MHFRLIALFLLISNTSYSETSCFPKNHLRFSPYEKNISRTQADLGKIIERFKAIFTPYLRESHNKKLIIKTQWDSSRVNASATRDDDNNPIIIVHGGLARHPELTDDGLTLILCHELGHYLGGAPRAFRGRSQKRSWSSAEGQADYFAVTKCLPRIFKNDKKAISYPNKRDWEAAQKLCTDNACTRIVMAGLSAAKMFASLKGGWEIPNLQNRDRSIVYQTEHGHPRPQCRLDTYISATHCDADININFDPNDPNIGACTSLGDSEFVKGARPFCWFRPIASGIAQ